MDDAASAAGRCRARSSPARRSKTAAAIVAATGGSTNAALHLPAIANEAGIAFTIDDVGEVFARTPLIGDLRPGGKYTAKDVYDIGGTAVMIRALIESGHIDGSCLTITGETLAEEYGDADAPDGEVICATARADHAGRRRRGAEGQSLPRWRVIKVAGLKKLVFEGPARVFEDEEDCVDAVAPAQLSPQATCSIIRNEGPVGGPGMREMLGVTALIYGQGMGEKVALSPTGAFPARRAACASAMSRRKSFVGGPLALVRDGDRIRIDAAARRMDLLVDDDELARTRAGLEAAAAAASRRRAGQICAAGRPGAGRRGDP